jgi:hypothetical protein
MIIANGGSGYAKCLTSIFSGLSSDELQFTQADVLSRQFQFNTIQSNNGYLYRPFWLAAYYDIYLANTVIEGVQASSSLSTDVRNQLLGEAKFLRGFVYFYLVNIFGDLPWVSTTSWADVSYASRTDAATIYQNIISDLKEARDLLPNNYDMSGGLRIRVNRAAAEALLARAYLYTGENSKAVESSSAVIGNSLFIMESNLNDVFVKGNREAIWQLEILGNRYPYATREAGLLIPEYLTRDYTPADVARSPELFVPVYSLTSQLLNAFELNDQRKNKWLDTTGLIAGVKYYYPYKYKLRVGVSGNVKEYYVMIRLAEQYLIRAEARARDGNLPAAVADLNVIRSRAGLPDLPTTLNQTQVLAAVAQENRIEFFGEWGHRWLDLKRTKQADAVLLPLKGGDWQTTDQLWPIPLSELQVNPNLLQNSGYE